MQLVERAVVDNEPYAVAFVDVRMPPGWDGIETTERLWRVQPNLQVVLCTAYSDYSWEEIFQRLGYTDQLVILKKPFDAVEVRQLALATTAKWSLMRRHEALLENLESQVATRTRELAASNERLRYEMQERLKVERQVRHLQKVQALGHLSASVGHEINNPLCYVVGNMELLSDNLRDLQDRPRDASLWRDTRQNLDAAVDGAHRIAEIVRAMRGFVSIDEDQAKSTVVASAIDTATALAHNEIRYRAQLRVQCEAIPPLQIGQRAFEQVLLNLLINAAHA
ncbi:MAG: response regulator, partial [Myxococcota bacterium]